MQPYFYMLVAFPGVGKSTWIKEHVIARKHPDSPIVLDTDSLIEEWSTAEGKTYSEGFKDHIDDATKVFMVNLKSALQNNASIMIDRTNLTLKGRKKLLDMVPKHYKKIAIIFSCSEETQKVRLKSRKGKEISWNIIENMKNSYVEPSLEEGFDEISRINTDGVNLIEKGE